jgi:BirA family biotin operon repressor/biotin-[acetyl-CoA-carboxylase] ligase
MTRLTTEAGLLTAAGYRILQVPSTGSTNEDAMAAAENWSEDNLVVWSLEQTGGQGRYGRSWASPKGNLYASILLHPECSLEQASQYSFLTSLAIMDSLQQFLSPERIRLKWPNDVLVDGKKVSGILLQSGPLKNDHVEWLVVGMGINVLSYPKDTVYPATALAECGVPPDMLDLQDMLINILNHFDIWQSRLKADGFAPLRQAWLKMCQGIGDTITVRLPNEELQGRFTSIDGYGALHLDMPDGKERIVAAGDVFFAPQKA